MSQGQTAANVAAGGNDGDRAGRDNVVQPQYAFLHRSASANVGTITYNPVTTDVVSIDNTTQSRPTRLRAARSSYAESQRRGHGESPWLDGHQRDDVGGDVGGGILLHLPARRTSR